MKSLNRRLCLETLEDRTVPSGCQAWGDHVATIAQTFEPNLGSLVSTIANTAPGAVAALVAADHEILCS
jgi:hypothetical protein